MMLIKDFISIMKKMKINNNIFLQNIIIKKMKVNNNIYLYLIIIKNEN
jgi:hypothetical protein